MRKCFCDHCGKELRGNGINELDCGDCFYDSEIQEFVGAGCTLCDKCWLERYQAHINLDMTFLHIAEEGME